MRLVQSELIKVRTARSFVVMILIALGLAALAALLATILSDYSGGGDPARGSDLVALSSLTLYFSLILGVLVVTSEYRHGSISATLLVEPRRLHLLVAKAIAAMVAGALLGIMALGLSLVLGAIVASSSGGSLQFSAADTLSALLTIGIAGALISAIGVGTGAILRNQVGSIIGLLIYIFLLEGLIGTFWEPINRFGYNGALSALLAIGETTEVSDPVSQVGGGLLFALYALVLCIAGAVMMQSRDVTD